MPGTVLVAGGDDGGERGGRETKRTWMPERKKALKGGGRDWVLGCGDGFPLSPVTLVGKERVFTQPRELILDMPALC